MPRLTELSTHQLIEHVGSGGWPPARQRGPSAHHAMAGAVIALSAAQACALGEACVHITCVHITCVHISAEQLQDRDRSMRAARASGELAASKGRLLTLADQDAAAITAFVALRAAGPRAAAGAGEMLAGQEMLCEAPVQIGRLAVEAARILQEFRTGVVEQVRDDLEMAIVLLTGAARAAALLLDSNLRIWPEEALQTRYEPLRVDLETAIARLTPVARIRT